MTSLLMVILGLGLLCFFGGGCYSGYSIAKKNPPPTTLSPSHLSAPIVNIDLDHVYKMLDQVPNKVLQSIISSTNNSKGNLGEMMGYLKLQAEYDRVIPLHSIVDFVCVSFPREGKEGHIDFLDVKTDKAKLSKDQIQLKKLIQEKKINFVKMTFKMTTEAENYDSTTETIELE